MKKIILIVTIFFVNVVNAQTELFGVTPYGGQYSGGVIFKTDSLGENQIVDQSFFSIEGFANKSNLIEATDGKFYGLTTSGIYSQGILFQYDPNTNIYLKKYSFDTISKGINPSGTLMQAADGKLYGMTGNGGLNNKGVLFQFDPITNVYIKKMDFDGVNYGSNPVGSLIQATDGKLYGMTPQGGISNLGVIFQYDLSTNIFTKKLDFDGSLKGANPSGSLMQANNGKLYGMSCNSTSGAGVSYGVLFQFDIGTSLYNKIFDFNTSFGGNPKGSLIQASDGNLYGMTSTGNGSTNLGCIFKYDFTALTQKVIFLGTSNGSAPLGNLTEGTDGKLYGMTESGGLNSRGVLFQYDYVAETMIKKQDFSGTTLGVVGDATLLQASNGKIYGISVTDGIANAGMLFEYNLGSSVFTKKIDFNMAPNGRECEGTLMKSSNGLIYAMTKMGGSSDGGVLLQYNPLTKTLTNLYNFNTTNGIRPNGDLIEASNGNLYGMCYLGGTKDYGVIFQYNPISNLYTKIYDLDTLNSGGRPYGSLMQASDGMLYGMTKEGGLYNQGTLFQFNLTTNVLTKKLDFAGSLGPINGSAPLGSLIQGIDGYLYGMTSQGGPSGALGNIFRFDISTNAYTNLFNFTGTSSGQTPYGPLMQASDGKLYGLNTQGGANGNGVLFQYDINTSSFVNKFDFNANSSGSFPFNGLIESSSNKLYGLTSGGGQNNMGVLFQYDISTSTYLKKLDFNSTNGRRPFCNLIKVPVAFAINTQTVNSGICAGNSINLTYSITGTYGSGNIFTVQLSDANGSFASPISIGTITSVSSGTLSAFTPSLSIQSNNYKVRVVSSNPFVVGNTYTNNIAIYASPTLAVNSGTICNGQSFTITANGAVTYTYSGGSNIVSPIADATYSVSGTDANGCISTTSAVSNVTVNSLPSLTITGTNTVCLGTSSAFTVNGGMAYTWSTGQASQIIYVNPTVTTSYSVSGTDMNGCINSQAVTLSVDNTCADVWPGDANSDGTVDNLDVLELGLHYTQTGAPRATTSNNWQSYFANNWVGTITNGKNLNHSDCNGDGAINDDDTLAIYNNYGLTHAFKPVQTTTVNPQFSIVPDQPMVVKGTWGTASVYLGDVSTPITNINGVAFSVDFDNTLIEPNSIYIEYQNSFIDASQNLCFRKLDFANAKLFTATTHTLSNNVSGFGKIATLHYQILSSLSTDQTLTLGITQANQSDASGTITPLTSGTGTLMAIGASVGVKESLISNSILISPNPTNGILNISFSSIPQNTKIEIYNSIGALVLTETMSERNNAINTSVLSSGMYFIKVIDGNKVLTVKKVVKE